MNKLPPARRFQPRPTVAGPTGQRSPFRWWMTGSLAVVMAALAPLRESAAGPQAGMRMLKHSRYGVEETLARIEQAAAGEGLSVLARLTGDRAAIVLASSVGGTLVVMDEPDSALAIPLGLVVRGDGRGGADVLATAGDRGAWSQVPDAVLRDVAGLPTLVERALG